MTASITTFPFEAAKEVTQEMAIETFKANDENTSRDFVVLLAGTYENGITHIVSSTSPLANKMLVLEQAKLYLLNRSMK